MKISGIIFDKDGTLLDFNEFWIPAAQCVIRRILSDYKIPVTDIHTEKALNSIGIIQNHVLPDGSFAWKTFLDMAIDMKPALEAMPAQAPVDTRDLEGKLTRYFDEESFAENKSIKGIGDLPAILQPLHEKSIHFGVATTDTCEAAVKCLKGLQILPLFSFFAGDQMAGDMPLKPDGRIISRAAAQWHIAPENILVVGDTINDMNFQRAHQQSLHAQRSIAQQRLDFGIHLPVILVDARFQCQKQLQKSRNALIPVLLAAQICFFPTFRVQFL